jgi:hypothetical protein
MALYEIHLLETIYYIKSNEKVKNMPYIIFTLMVFSEEIMSAVNFNMRLEAELKEQVKPISSNNGLNRLRCSPFVIDQSS